MFPDPSLTVPSLNVFEFSFAGYTWGGNQPAGVMKGEGFGSADVRSGDKNLPRDFGQILGLDVYGGRDLIFDMWLTSDGTSMQDTQLQLAAATVADPSGETPLWFQLPNLPIMCIQCRPRKRPMTIDAAYANANVGKPTLTLHATDPRIYAAGQQVSLTLAPTTGGLTFGDVPGDSTWPYGSLGVTFGVITGDPTPPTGTLTFGSAVSTPVTVTNSGNMETRPLIVFNGPLTNPGMTNLTLGATLQVSNPASGQTGGTGFTVVDGDQLTINTQNHLIQYWPGGIAANAPYAAAGWLTVSSSWWNLPPGNSSLEFTSGGSGDVGTAAVQWASAWQL